MRRFRRPFGKLYWRLALSYILVTLVVVIIAEVVNTVSTIATYLASQQSYQASQQSDQIAGYVNPLAEFVAPQLSPSLEQSPPDKQELTAQIEILIHPSNLPPKKDPFALGAVLDVDGQVLASASSTGALNPDDIKNPQAQQVIHVALLGDPYPPYQTRTLPDGRTVVAIPILAQDGQRVLGALFAIPAGWVLTNPGKRIDPLVDALAIIRNALNPGVLSFMFLACIVGTLSGLLASRGITHRLRRIARATHSWSQGDFQVEVDDRSPDELGQLAGDLNSMAEQLQHFITARQELAVLEERHRLARDLHDSIKQQLFVITMLVGAARAQVSAHPDAAQTLSEAEHLAGQTQQELNALIRALRPVVLAEKGLGAALQDLLSGWSQSTGIAAELNLASDVSLPQETEQALFRVVQETLTNVARHSGATAIEASVVGEPERVRLTVEDNGHGFSIAQNSGQGQGLRSMRERVEALDGTLLIFSTSAGTRVEACIPLPPQSSVERDEKTTTYSSLGI